MPDHKQFYLKNVGFVGRFKGGSKSLKDLVYLADGAPVDNIPVYTNYLVVGDGGKTTKGYEKVALGIERGATVVLTPEQLIDIVEGRTELPKPNPMPQPNRVIYTTREAEKERAQLELYMWEAKRDAYVRRHGIPVADNMRIKMDMRFVKAMQKLHETEIISVRSNAGYLDRAIDYFSSKWPVARIVYQDCITNSLTTENPIPQWYLLLNGTRDIIGCFGLIMNDFISRQDLWPWVCALYVDEAYRGHSFGAKMLEHGRREAKRLGFSKLYLATDHVGYYEKYGWSYIGDGYAANGEPGRIYEINTD